MTPRASRSGPDRCPGALQPFSAEDGLIVRARVPGGEISLDALCGLMTIGREHGAPRVQLTSRGNLQVRGLPEPLPGQVAQRIADLGLLPSWTHEKARNILAAPTNRRLRAWARELDRRLCARPALAALPGRFLFLLTDDSGLGLDERFDVAYVDRPGGTGLLLAGGRARPCAEDQALQQMLEVAERFLEVRSDERVWNIRDLPADSLLGDFAAHDPVVGSRLAPGAVGEDLVAGVPLGLVEPEHLDALRPIADSVVVTPWRSLLIEGGAAYARTLRDAGLVTSAESAWARISACTGAPYCARAQTSTWSLAGECAQALPADGPRLHLVGCERRCGQSPGGITVVGARSVAEVRRSESGHRFDG